MDKLSHRSQVLYHSCYLTQPQYLHFRHQARAVYPDIIECLDAGDYFVCTGGLPSYSDHICQNSKTVWRKKLLAFKVFFLSFFALEASEKT